MVGSIIINYTTTEILDHSQSQVIKEKPATITEFKNKIAETIQKYFGEFLRVYEHNDNENKGKNADIEQSFSNQSVHLSISEKVRSSEEPTGLKKLFNSILKKDSSDETITYKTTIRIKGYQQKFYLKESSNAITELAEIIETQRQTDESSKIKYKMSDFQ